MYNCNTLTYVVKTLFSVKTLTILLVWVSCAPWIFYLMIAAFSFLGRGRRVRRRSGGAGLARLVVLLSRPRAAGGAPQVLAAHVGARAQQRGTGPGRGWQAFGDGPHAGSRRGASGRDTAGALTDPSASK